MNIFLDEMGADGLYRRAKRKESGGIFWMDLYFVIDPRGYIF